MTAEVRQLVTLEDGTRTCGTGTPTTMDSSSGNLAGMGRLVTLLEARLEDLMATGIGPPTRVVPGTGTDEIQIVSITGSPGQGKFLLGLDGTWTTQLPYHPAAGEMQSALAALPNIGYGNVLVSKDSNWVYRVTFQAAMGSQNVNKLDADYSQMGGGATVQVTVDIQGQAPSGGTPGISAATYLAPDGQLMIELTDPTQSWTYRVLPAVSADSQTVLFLGLLAQGLPNA